MLNNHFPCLFSKLRKPWIIGGVEPFSGDCVIDRWCFASTKCKEHPLRVLFLHLVTAEAIEPYEFCAQVMCGDALYRGRKTSAMFSRFCGAKQRLSKPLRGNSTDFAAGECPRFPSPLFLKNSLRHGYRRATSLKEGGFCFLGGKLDIRLRRSRVQIPSTNIFFS